MAHQVLIEPGYGYDGAEFDAGPMAGRLIGWEVVDKVVPGMLEEFFIEGIHCEVIQNRKKPGMTKADRLVKMESGVLVVRLEVGLDELQATHTRHTGCKELAGRMHRAVMDWGKAVNIMHADGGCKVDKKIYPDAHSKEIVVISLFNVDAPGHEGYEMGLERIGKSLAATISRYAKEQNPTLGFKPRMVTPRPWLEEKAARQSL